MYFAYMFYRIPSNIPRKGLTSLDSSSRRYLKIRQTNKLGIAQQNIWNQEHYTKSTETKIRKIILT